MKRKILSILFVVVLALSISACGKRSTDIELSKQEERLTKIRENITSSLEYKAERFKYESAEVDMDSLKIILLEDGKSYEAYGKASFVGENDYKSKVVFVASGTYWHVGSLSEGRTMVDGGANIAFEKVEDYWKN